MRRRRFFEGFALLCLGMAPYAVAQQAAKIVRIGRLSPLSETAELPMIDGLRAGLAELGWIEGRTSPSRCALPQDSGPLAALADDLVHRHVDVIVTGSNPGALAAKRATQGYRWCCDYGRSGVCWHRPQPGEACRRLHRHLCAGAGTQRETPSAAERVFR